MDLRRRSHEFLTDRTIFNSKKPKSPPTIAWTCNFVVTPKTTILARVIVWSDNKVIISSGFPKHKQKNYQKHDISKSLRKDCSEAFSLVDSFLSLFVRFLKHLMKKGGKFVGEIKSQNTFNQKNTFLTRVFCDLHQKRILISDFWFPEFPNNSCNLRKWCLVVSHQSSSIEDHSRLAVNKKGDLWHCVLSKRQKSTFQMTL